MLRRQHIVLSKWIAFHDLQEVQNEVSITDWVETGKEESMRGARERKAMGKKRGTLWIVLLLAAGMAFAQEEPPLYQVIPDLHLQVGPGDEWFHNTPVQGIFVKTAPRVEVLLVAKYSFTKQEILSEVRAGYYFMENEEDLIPLFTCGPEAGEQSSITGLPAQPRGPYFIDPGKKPFGFYVQSANFNPAFSTRGETVCTQDQLNRRITRFGNNIHKARVYLYRDGMEVKPNWYLICWEFSTNDDFQDLITVVRGVSAVDPPASIKSHHYSEPGTGFLTTLSRFLQPWNGWDARLFAITAVAG